MTACKPDHQPDFEALYLALIGSHSDLVSRYDADGHLDFVSDSYVAFFGMSRDDLIGTSIYDLITHEERLGTQQRLASVTPDSPSVSGRNKVTVRDGSVRHVEWVTTGLFSDRGDLVVFQSVGRDVTSLVHVREQLTESETRYAQAVQIASLGYWIWDEVRDRLEFCSREAAEIYGVTVEQALERSSSIDGNVAAVHPQDRQNYKHVIEDAAERAIGYDVTFRCLRPNGELRYIREVAEPVIGPDGNLVQTIGTVQDVTDQKLAEQELRSSQILLERQIRELRESEQRLQKQSRDLTELAGRLEKTRSELETADNQKKRLFSIIAHDLKSPFMPLLGFSELLASSSQDLPRQTISEYARSIHQTAFDIHSLLSDLLEWSALQLDRLTLEHASLDLDALAGLQVTRFAQAARAKNIALSIDSESSDNIARADGRIIDTVLRNLVSNAVKFTHEGGAVRIRIRRHDKRIDLCVNDNGAGLPDEVRSAMSGSGPVGSRAGTHGEKGTGLGLMLCKELMELHDSRLSFAANAGGGTSVSFSLPAYQAD